MGESPMVDSPMGESPMGNSPTGDSLMVESPMGGIPHGDSSMGESPMGESPMGDSSPELTQGFPEPRSPWRRFWEGTVKNNNLELWGILRRIYRIKRILAQNCWSEPPSTRAGGQDGVS